MRKASVLSIFTGSVLVLSALFVNVYPNLVPSVLGTNNGLADSPWPVFHGDVRLTGQSPYDTSHVDGTIKWRVKANHWIESSPVIGPDQTIYFADHTCTLYAVSPEGKVKWEFSGGEPVYSKEWGSSSCSQATPAVAKDGTVYFLPMTGDLYAVNPYGKEKWRYPVFAFKNVWASPTVGSDGTIYVGSEAYPPSESGKKAERTAHFHAINPDGTLKWEYDSKSVWMNSTPSISFDGTIYLPGGIWSEELDRFVNAVYAFNPDGSIKWTFIPPGGVMEGSIAVGDDGTLYFTTKGERDPRTNAIFYALTPDKEIKWTFKIEEGASSTPGLSSSGNIYFGDWGGTFYALNNKGELLWKVDTPLTYEALSSSPSIGSDGTIYVGTSAGYFFAFTPEGKEKWRLDEDVRDGGVMATPAIGEDGTIYITTLQRELLAIGSSEELDEVDRLPMLTDTKSEYVLPVVILSFVGLIGLLLALKIKRKISNKMLIITFLLSILLLGAFIYVEKLREPRNLNTDHQKDVVEVSDVKNLCPQRVYGSEEKGYYGPFYINYDVEQFDITPEHLSWIEKNCPKTIWPQEMFEGYKGDH